MRLQTQGETPPRGGIPLVGMDLHSEKVQLCITRWAHGSDPVKVQSIATTLAALEGTYRNRVPEGALTVLEASTNAFAVVRRLEAIGYEAKVLVSDIAKGLSSPDRINDAIDAYNIAAGYARRGAERTEVFVPSVQYQQYRDAWFLYRNAGKDAVRCRNRLWSFCKEQGADDLARLRTPGGYRRAMEELEEEGRCHPLLGILVADFEHACNKKDSIRKHMQAVAAVTPAMRTAMSVLGVDYTTAFALVAAIEDIRRFPTARKLCSYLALNPKVCESGEDNGQRHVSKCGRNDLKALLVEGAQSAYPHGTQPMHKWARRKVASGKPRNLVLVALARKMAVALWHALMGHPVPGREAEAGHIRKLAKAARSLGQEALEAMGYKSAKAFAEAVAREYYAHLPKPVETEEKSKENTAPQRPSTRKKSKKAS
jgi:transposase